MACCSLLLIVVTSSCLLLVGCDPLGDSAAGAAVNDESAMMERFIRWMAAQKRSYSSVEEKQRRFEIYASNVRYIEEVNAKGLTYMLGEGLFTDLTHDEFVARYTGGFRASAVDAVDDGPFGSIAHILILVLVLLLSGPVLRF